MEGSIHFHTLYSMKTNTLGRTGLKIPEMGFGTAFLGGRDKSGGYDQFDLELGAETIVKAIEAGCRFFDTAPLYSDSRSETMIGMALRSRPDLKESLIVTTKVGQIIGSRDYSYDAILRNVEDSQKRLDLDRFEILYVHDAINVPMEEVMGKGGALEALRKLQGEGIVNHIGTAANDPDANGPYIETGEFDVALVADAWSLINQRANQYIFPAAKKHNVGIIVATPLERGLLATGPTEDNRYLNRNFSSEIIAHVGQIQDLCKKFDLPLLAVSLQWCLNHPQVSSIVPGISHIHEAKENMAAVSMDIPTSFWLELEPLVKDWTDLNFVVEAKDFLKKR